MKSADQQLTTAPPCHRCGAWVPQEERAIDEHRNGSQFILCHRCDTEPTNESMYPMNVMR